MKVFLGGTCNGSKWREELIPMLKERGIKYFNPLVKNWNEAARKKEKKIKEDPDTINLFVISKEINGVYSIAEAVDSVHLKPKKTVFVILDEGFSKEYSTSLWAVASIIGSRGGLLLMDLEATAKLLKIMTSQPSSVDDYSGDRKEAVNKSCRQLN